MKTEKVSIAKQKAYLAKYIRDLKEKSPCMDCGINYPYYVMDFDHVRGKKHKNVMELIPTLSKKKIDEEIAKCELVCSIVIEFEHIYVNLIKELVDCFM